MNRRTIIAGGAAIMAVAVGMAVLRPDRLLKKSYPPTPYDDLLTLLPDRDDARQIGRAYLSRHNNFTPKAAARVLREHVGGRPLDRVIASEVVDGQLVEAAHWIMPETLVGLCALAARS